MIKHGAFLLKKLNAMRWFRNSLPALFICLFSLFIFGCKSVPTLAPVDPLDLLDNESAFYISIPSSVDPELISKIITNNVEGMSAEDAQKTSEMIKKVYCGMNRSRKGTDYQISMEADVPVKYIPKILTEKKGWGISTFKPENSTSDYKIYSMDQMDISFPSGDVACFGRDLTGMLAKYDYISTTPVEEAAIEDVYYSDLDPDMHDWLKEAETEIRFYANKPQSFLTLLTGAQLDLKLFYVKGAFYVDENFPEQYILNLDFMFKNEKYRKAGKTLLTIAFGLTDSQSIVIETNELQINGIKLKKEQLYNLFID